VVFLVKMVVEAHHSGEIVGTVVADAVASRRVVRQRPEKIVCVGTIKCKRLVLVRDYRP